MKSREQNLRRTCNVAIVLLLCLTGTYIMVLGQKAVAPIPIAPEAAQKIRDAFRAEQSAEMALSAARSERARIVAEAINEAQCWKCTLGQDPASGNLVFVKPEPPKETPKP